MAPWAAASGPLGSFSPKPGPPHPEQPWGAPQKGREGLQDLRPTRFWGQLPAWAFSPGASGGIHEAHNVCAAAFRPPKVTIFYLKCRSLILKTGSFLKVLLFTQGGGGGRKTEKEALDSGKLSGGCWQGAGGWGMREGAGGR